MAIMRFRCAQNLACGFADRGVSREQRIEHESLSSTSSSDHHVIVGNARNGEILCYLAVRRVQPAWPRQRMRSHLRQPFPVEEMHGMGIYDRLSALPDMQVARVCETGRFVTNQRLHVFDELGTRAPIEALAERSVARRLKAFLCDGLASGHIAQQMAVFMRSLRLAEVTVTSGTVVRTGLDAADRLLQLTQVALGACRVGVITEAEHDALLSDLREQDAAGAFAAALTGYITVAKKAGARGAVLERQHALVVTSPWRLASRCTRDS